MKKCAHECGCPCHEAGSEVVHIMACYDRCELCNRNIRRDLVEEHKKTCHQDQE